MDGKGKDPATKADLQNLRGELKGDAARLDQKIEDVRGELKGDFTRLDQKIEDVRGELKGDIKKLGLELVKTNVRMDKMGESLRGEMRGGFHQMTGRIDRFLDKLETYARESVTIPRTLDEHGKRLRDHDRRLTRLESPPS